MNQVSAYVGVRVAHSNIMCRKFCPVLDRKLACPNVDKAMLVMNRNMSLNDSAFRLESLLERMKVSLALSVVWEGFFLIVESVVGGFLFGITHWSLTWLVVEIC